jgi:hypothetical protein
MKHVQQLTAQTNKQETPFGSLNQQLGCYLFQNYEEEENVVHEWLWMQETNSVIKEFLNLYMKGGKMHQWAVGLCKNS